MRAGSNPVITAEQPLARSSNGSGYETLILRDTGSTPVRAAYDGEVVESVDTRRSECRALAACEFDSRLRHLNLAGGLGPNWLSYGRCARFDTGTCNCGWASAHPGLISLDCRCATPGPAT